MSGTTVRFELPPKRTPGGSRVVRHDVSAPVPEPAPEPAPATSARDNPTATGHPATALARRLALAHYIERLVESGVLKDYAAAARLLGVTRARLTQLIDLFLLPGEVQEAILTGQLRVSERTAKAGQRQITAPTAGQLRSQA